MFRNCSFGIGSLVLQLFRRVNRNSSLIGPSLSPDAPQPLLGALSAADLANCRL